MTFKDICTKRVFTGKDGAEKTTWLKAGTLRILDNDKIFIELNHLPDVSFYVFDQKEYKPKEAQEANTNADPVDWDD